MVIRTKSGSAFSAHFRKELSNQQIHILGKSIPNIEIGALDKPCLAPLNSEVHNSFCHV